MRRLLFAVAIIAFITACEHKPTPEEIATQKATARRKTIDSSFAAGLALHYDNLDKGLAAIRDSTRPLTIRKEVMEKLQKWYPEYMTKLEFSYDFNNAVSHNGVTKKITTNVYGPYADSIIVLQKALLKAKQVEALNQQLEADKKAEEEQKN